MSKDQYIIALDQGTTSTRCIVFNQKGEDISTSRREFAQHYPELGWVEHNPEDIWNDAIYTIKTAISEAKLEGNLASIAAIGITNQRETVVLWDKATGKPIYNAIVWQDRRTSAYCQKLKAAGLEKTIHEKTGLLLDPYFSASKLAWLLDNVAEARSAAERGELAFGTVDSFLLWRLTGGKVHATDATNASRTLLFNIKTQSWDPELLKIFNIPETLLPEVKDNSTLFGVTDPNLFGHAIPIMGMAGDQQAALIGQACFDTGMTKATYGTGCFMLLNTGDKMVISQNRMLTTTAYRLNGKPTYALEGSIFVAGAAIKWLRDGLGLITHASQTQDMATQVEDNHQIYMVPAFVGLGAPHWAPDARAIISGLTFGATAAHIARAALESIAYQTHDLAEAMKKDSGNDILTTRVDGGMSANDWFCQFLADIMNITVERPSYIETTAMGAAYLAGMGCGLWSDLSAIQHHWKQGESFISHMKEEERKSKLKGWKHALKQALLPEDE
ncbi:Glycerol kinase (GlpK) (PDB:2ZF5) [Commensalibacter communis]|uniref:Glycerol kinase n=1 Tax=Commensalibacter communis TaxID=2972786 RepID=A0A9W4X9L8_9PROT|nr:glycerol kinase GlpK [Commensalibacter communis]CAI3938059.1 Glycerol kinase (GlpK) (PDB:2ZF5) [Commensalibacter communis]CAI3940004.1 Glycerol kinase (GlpK) (PDB:2ZF5) [Commensalibacter communis]CAI3940181.1 Glycerol kinase (GlpK) (PDB:2ZF5) [Commensalibacter communis]CAI3940344.1 Glycerol kinase (GlpK) (PDB:2ZF5) [Commensalibacter communis]CAI3943498.1 Glycerol kinase (GlpK) (PDB:2ZF5) [Commensalibacter communis]